jgi:hypothetical protein
VSLRVDYDERAIDQAAAFLDDPPGIREVLDAIDPLARGRGSSPSPPRPAQTCIFTQRDHPQMR